MKKISLRIAVAIVVCSMTIGLLIGAISIVRSTAAIKQESTRAMQFLAESNTGQLSKVFVDVEAAVHSLDNTISSTLKLQELENDTAYLGKYDLQVSSNIKKSAEASPNTMSAYFAFNPELTGTPYDISIIDEDMDRRFERGSKFSTDSSNPNSGFMQWYQQAAKAEKGIWTSPYEYETTIGKKVKMISYITPVYIDKALVGVAGMDIRLDHLSTMVNNIKTYQTGYAFLLNEKFDYIVHKTLTDKDNMKTVSNGLYRSLAEKMSKNSSDIVTTTFGGIRKVMGYSHLANGFMLVITVPESEIFKPIREITTVIFFVFLIGIFITLILAYFLGSFIAKPVKFIAEHLRILSTGDFQQPVPSKYMKAKDETGILARSANAMQNAIRDIIHGVLDESRHVDETVNKVSHCVDTLKAHIEEIAATTQQLSAGMEQTAASAEEMDAVSTEIDAAIQSISGKAQEGVSALGEINQRASGLKSKAITSREYAHAIYSDTQQKLQSAIDQSKAVDKITALANAILQITSQTNLLALNAAIEAARAGEAGKGFAVVADEIRKLAEDSKSTVSEIQKITNIVLSSVDNLSMSSQKVLEFINQQVINDYEVLVSTGEEYSMDAKFVETLVGNFSSASQELTVSTHNMITAISEISTATNEGANSTSDIALKINNIAEISDEVHRQGMDSKESVRKLMDMVSQFKV